MKNRRGSRSIYTTTDLGETWTEHSTFRKALPNPVCNADILRVVHPMHAPLLFFEPEHDSQAIKIHDQSQRRRRYDVARKMAHAVRRTLRQRLFNAYARIDADHIGVHYEGSGELHFLRFSIDELFNK